MHIKATTNTEEALAVLDKLVGSKLTLGSFVRAIREGEA